MKVRRIILEEDYETLQAWWTRRGKEPPSRLLLPETGVLVYEDAEWLACAFLYEDAGGRIGMVEWEATNPACASPMKALRALNLVFDFFEKYALDHGLQVLLSWVASERGDGRLLDRRKWAKCAGERHELMAFVGQPQEALCP